TFINADNYSEKALMWQTLIHVTFLLSALAIAATDRLMVPKPTHAAH
ncbi:MAG: TIGR00645 family protein, partial [Rubrivivax sp.]